MRAALTRCEASQREVVNGARGAMFRIGESFEALREAALAPGGISDLNRPLALDAGEPLPCFCAG